MFLCAIHGCRPPNWIFVGSVFWIFYTFREPTVYISTKFCENILIGAKICPQTPVCCMYCGMAAVCQIGISKKVHLGHFIPWGSPLPTYPPNFMKIYRLGAEICPQNEIWNQPSGGRILLPATILTTLVLWGQSSVSSYKISRKSLNARLVITIQLFLYLPLNLQLWTAQWHSAVMQAIYNISLSIHG